MSERASPANGEIPEEDDHVDDEAIVESFVGMFELYPEIFEHMTLEPDIYPEDAVIRELLKKRRAMMEGLGDGKSIEP